ncbi:hypothetical protein [Ruegeria sp. Ofav3-42]|uniref:hypothetical protein n=1 Tax=Ruegeria sp. Ofav3-42 TaxID=2917759 RepID=UPI001EF429C7|nr:hypothetical protein [Ruegeria sp. Ofav3-42]MCG7520739.1 hypothetical protein [Ruegeria sp. Ofav3-42]
MLSIFARTFMIATQTYEHDEKTPSDRRKEQKQHWLPENHWWKEAKRAVFSQHG